MGHLPIGFFLAPFVLGLIATLVLFVAHAEGDLLNKLGLLNHMSVSVIYGFGFLATTAGLYCFVFSAPNCPITIHENGIKHKGLKLLYSDILGVRAGSGEIEGQNFGMSITPVGRLARAIDNLEVAHHNVLNCSIHIMKSDYNEVTISKGLVLYEQADLTKLVEVVEAKTAQPTGLSFSVT